MTNSKPESIWSGALALLCFDEFVGYALHAVLQATFPLYITHLGGAPLVVGLVIASFGVTSVISRPILGYWADRWSVTGVMILGFVAQAASLSLCLIPFAGATMFANGLRGIGWSGMNTGAYTLLAISAPSERRGEASGYFGSAQSAATVLLPAVALWVIEARFGGFHAAFILAMSLVLAGAGVGYALSREIPPAPRGSGSESTKSRGREIISVFDRSVVLPAALTFLLHLPAPCLTSYIVLYARDIGVGDFGWYYVVIGATSMLARPLLGRVSDKIGCGRALFYRLSHRSGAPYGARHRERASRASGRRPGELLRRVAVEPWSGCPGERPCSRSGGLYVDVHHGRAYVRVGPRAQGEAMCKPEMIALGQSGSV